MDSIIPSARVDPVAHTALSLTTATAPDHIERPSAVLDVLASHGLIGAAATEGRTELAAAANPAHFRLLMRQRVMDRHRADVVASLDDAGIPGVVLKGRSVARWYANPDIRTSTDIDLLVPPDRVEEAVATIRRHAAVTDVPSQGPEADKRHIMFRDASGVAFILDLHWHLFSYHQMRGRADSALSEVWANANRSDIGWQLPLGAEVSFLAAHAVLDHRFRLILFRDLAEIARSEPDWEEIGRFADRHGVRSVTWAALSTARRFANAEIPSAFLDALRCRSVPERAYETWLARIDPVRFDGRSRHPLNLASVLLHDDRFDRIALIARAPAAFGRWKRKREVTHHRGVRRALVVVTSNARRGAEVFGEGLSLGLRDRGWDVKFVCLSMTGGPSVSAVPVRGATFELGRLSPALVAGLRAEMRNADVVLLNGSATLRYGVAASMGLSRRPSLIYGSIGEPGYWATTDLQRRRQRMLLARVDLVGAVSKATMSQLETTMGLDESVIRYAPTGVVAVEGREHRQPADQPLQLVWVGSLSHEKRPELLFDVLRHVTAPVRVALLGDGPLRADVERRAAMDGRVSVVGPVADISQYLASADALIQTSATEGLPGVVMEAAAAGVPSVAFDVGGTSELVIDGRTGRLIPSDDVAEMARVVDQLAADPELGASLGAAALGHVMENFSLDAAIGRWHEIFEAAMKARRG